MTIERIRFTNNEVGALHFATLMQSRIRQLADQIARLDDDHDDCPRFEWSYEHDSDPDTLYLTITTPSNRDRDGDYVCSHETSHTIPWTEIFDRTEEEDDCDFPFPAADEIRAEVELVRRHKEEQESAERLRRDNRLRQFKEDKDRAELRRLISLYPI